MTSLLHPPETHKLGKLAPKPSRLQIAHFVDVERVLAEAPLKVVNSNGTPLAMYLNDKYGDCTCAAIGNTLRVNSKGTKQLVDSDILTAYENVTGQEGARFNPADDSNDNGCVEIDVLDYWSKTGVGGDKLLGHAGVDMKNLDEVRSITFLFGSVYLGLALAAEQKNQQVWDYVPSSSPGSWGGHAVPLFDLDATNPKAITGAVGTWGAYKDVTGPFLTEQADEGHALITQEWLDANKANPAVNSTSLEAAFAYLQSEK